MLCLKESPHFTQSGPSKALVAQWEGSRSHSDISLVILCAQYMMQAGSDRLCLSCRPLAPGRYNITVSYKGFANEKVTVDVPKDGSGAKLDVFLVPAAMGVVNWGLARKFGPLNTIPTAEDGRQVTCLNGSCQF